jgi:asparagine synthase (glutamine-hydrolysing)
MPGIVGIVSQRPPEECRSLVNSMTDIMEHESFYDSGMYFVPELGIYAGWVAHEGSLAAGQPFFNEERDVVLLFSGECFVDPETRTALRQKGHEVGQAAGNWMVHLYEEEGDRFFEKLNGLFSGLLIDRRQGKTFLFNDRYGVERIYWNEANGAVFFASEAKALLRVLPKLRTFDQEGLAQFLTFGCTLGERTLFRGVQLLPGASVWTFEKGSCRKNSYFSPRAWELQSTLPAESFGAELEDTFKRVLPRYFASDSRIGISLTAGLDSRMIMACLPKDGEKPACYTFAGPRQDTLDARLAGRVAKACGLEHKIFRLGEDFFLNFASHADRTVYITDGCVGTLAAHEISLNKQARQLAPVRVTGVFGGELLREVSMFKPFPLSPGLVNPDLDHSVNSLARDWTRNEHPVTFTAFREIPQKRFGTPAASRSQMGFRTPYLDNEIVALAYRAPESVRASPFTAWSIVQNNRPVLSRIPTDTGVVAKATGPSMMPRRVLSKAVCKLDYLYSEGLPHWLSPFDRLFDQIDNRVRLFGWHKFLHYRRWFRRELADYVAEVLKDVQTSRRNPFWNYAFLETLASDHINGRKNYVHEIDAVLTLDAVDRLLFHDLPSESERCAPAIRHRAPASIEQ